MGEHVQLSFWFSASVYIYLLTSYGQHITPLPGSVRKQKKKTQTRRELEFIGMQQHVWLDMYTVTITHYKKGKERERVTHMKSWRVSSPVWTCTELSIPWAQCLCFWSCQLCAALSDGSPNESFGPRSSTGKKPGPQREVSKRNSNLRVLGERRQTAYQRLIKP